MIYDILHIWIRFIIFALLTNKYYTMDAIYTIIITFEPKGKQGWYYSEVTPGLDIIGQVFTPKPLTYKEAEELIEEEKEDFDPNEYYSCYGKFIEYKIIPISEVPNLD